MKTYRVPLADGRVVEVRGADRAHAAQRAADVYQVVAFTLRTTELPA